MSAVRREGLVPAEQGGARADLALAALWPEFSRSRIQGWIRAGQVTVDGRVLRPRDPVAPGAKVVLETTLEPAGDDQPEAIPLEVAFEDDALLVVNKPAGMVVHPAAGHGSGTLVNALLHHVKDLSGVGGEMRPGIVHRLDKGTSGVMVVAKNDAAHQELARQFHDREVEKEYVALVWGIVHARKRIDSPIGRDPGNRQKMSSRARRSRTAVTRVTWARHLPGVSLLRVAIFTGRTHQIRVHLSAIGHPIVGDPTYGAARDLDRMLQATRPVLHAALLAFDHPITGERIQV
ncbi:MAG: RluA family pseudouridine synthase, partial [Gammaproteobacteria bacterium]